MSREKSTPYSAALPATPQQSPAVGSAPLVCSTSENSQRPLFTLDAPFIFFLFPFKPFLFFVKEKEKKLG
jgi:hypothetical protein